MPNNRRKNNAMNVIKTPIEGVVIIEPQVFRDARGYFFESYSERRFNEQVAPVRFVQDNESRSTRGVVRGIHFQRPPYTQSKLVRVLTGRVLDVAVDLRRDSPTFGHHVSVVLSGRNRLQLFIPRGFGHGFSVLSKEAVFQYKCDAFYEPRSEGSVRWDDPSLAIDWRLPKGVEPCISDKDRVAPLLAQADIPF